MALDISGKVVQILPEQTGVSTKGNWVKQDFVIETTEQYPKKVCFTAFGEKASQVKSLQVGETVTVSFNMESREFNGKWYTNINAWKVVSGGGQQSANDTMPAHTTATGDATFSTQSTPADDLPF